MQTFDDLGPEERLLTANRLLLVLEQLFVQASIDPNQHPFSGPHIPDFCLGVVNVVRLVRDLLRDLPTVPPEV